MKTPSSARPIVPPRLRAMLNSPAASAVSVRLTAPTEIWFSGMKEKIWPTPRSSCEAMKSPPAGLRGQVDVDETAGREAQQAEAHDQLDIAEAQDARQHRHQRERRQSGQRQDASGLIGVIAGHTAEELRQHVQDVVEHHADGDDDQDHAGVGAVVEQPQLEHRPLAGELRDAQRRESQHCEHGQPADHVRIEPLIALAFLEHDRQAAQTDRTCR